MYKNIVAAVSLFDKAGQSIVRTAQSLLADGGTLKVLYVLDTRYVQFVFDPTFSASANEDLAADAQAQASEKLVELCEPLGIDAGSTEVLLGHPASLIREVAADNDCDLIVMGTHGRRGWRRILGSVASEVLHGAPTNVFLCRSALKED